MDFFSSGKSEKPGSGGLFSSAKLVADAAKSAVSGGSEAIDKEKVAGAAADLLGAASDYAKLDETKGVGKYVDQAEDYLHKYNKSNSPAPPVSEKPIPDAEKKPEPVEKPAEEPVEKPVEEPAKKEASGAGEPGSGVGGYLKLAEGLFKH